MKNLNKVEILAHIDNSESYRFEVNKETTIRNLKKIIEATANLNNKKKINIKRGLTDYTDCDDSIDRLFPNDNNIEIFVDFTNLTEKERLEHAFFKLGIYCKNHTHMFPYFYCFSCKESICFCCIKTSHIGHDYFDKHIYLLNSRDLVESFIREKNYDFLEILDNKEKFSIHSLTQFIERKYENLHKMLDQIKQVAIEYINRNDPELILSLLSNNYESFINDCEQKFDKLKSHLHIQDIMLDDKIFLKFFNDFRDIILNNENMIDNKLIEDSKYHCRNIDNIKYDESIEEFLQSKILTGFIKTEGKSTFSKNKEFSNNSNNNTNNNANTDKVNQGQVIYSPIENEDSSKNKPNILNINNTKNNIIINVDESNKIKEQFNQTKTSIIHSHSPRNNEQINSQNRILHYIDNSNELFDFNYSSLEITSSIVSIPSLIIPNQLFPSNSASCQVHDTIYISGGQIKENTRLFFSLDTKIRRLSDMNKDRVNHSMIYHNDFIYAVGGVDNQTVERFNIHNKKWENLKSMNYQRESPILFANNDYIYCFFGTHNKIYQNTIERLNLKILGNWDLLPSYKDIDDPKNVELTHSGVIPLNKSEILFLGGKNVHGNQNSCFIYNLNSFSFRCVKNLSLNEEVTFKESSLCFLKNKTWGGFNTLTNNVVLIEIPEIIE